MVDALENGGQKAFTLFTSTFIIWVSINHSRCMGILDYRDNVKRVKTSTGIPIIAPIFIYESVEILMPLFFSSV